MPKIGRRRAVALALFAALAVGISSTPASSRTIPDAPLAAPAHGPAQEGDGADLKEQYEEITAAEAEMLAELDRAQLARKDASEQLFELNRQTQAKQVELLEATQELQAADALAARRVEERARAEKRAAAARDRLRKQIVASYVTGGDVGGQMEAFLSAQTGEQVGQALAYGHAISNSTETLVEELEKAEAERAEAAQQARDAQALATAVHDDIESSAEFLVAARAKQQELLTTLNFEVLAEADALRKVQGQKAIVEGRINSINRASDGVAQILSTLQADQPIWEPGSVKITTPIPGAVPGSEFGMRLHPILGIERLHAGVDIGEPSGTMIYAPADAVVVLAEVRGGYGNTVVLDHGNSLATLYGHTSQMLVEPGQLVQRGDPIARVGSTGLSTGPHLHFETRIKGIPIDPEGVIDFTEPVDYDGDGEPDTGD